MIGGSRGICAYEWHRAREAHGDDSPAARARLGRLLYWIGHVPQRGSTSIESIAWHRESGAIPGYLNRSERRSAS